MTKKFVVEPCRVGKREKVLKSFWKSGLNKSNMNFLKTLFSKFNWSKQQFRSIEIDKDSIKILSAILIVRKNRLNQSKHRDSLNFEKKLETSQSIEIDEQNAWVCDEMFFKNNSFKPSFPKVKISYILHKFSSIKSVLRKNSKYMQTWLVRLKNTHKKHVQCLAKSNLYSVCN